MSTRGIVSVIIVFFGALSAILNAQHTCRDEANNAVDWWILYKFPAQIGDGLRYVYRTSTQPGSNVLSPLSINSPNSILNRTIENLIRSWTGTPYVTFNDEGLGGVAHAKGVAVFPNSDSGGGGYWITHTVPYLWILQGNREDSQYPSNGLVNGQTAICISLNRANTVGNNNLWLRLCHMGIWHIGNDPCINIFPPYPRMLDFEYSVGTNMFRFYSHADRGDGGQDVYTRFAALVNSPPHPYIVQTWRRSGGTLPNNDHVTNAECVVVRADMTDWPWASTVDHAKLATNNQGYYCFGDLNREQSQTARGGGLVCFQLHGGREEPFAVFPLGDDVPEWCRSHEDMDQNLHPISAALNSSLSSLNTFASDHKAEHHNYNSTTK